MWDILGQSQSRQKKNGLFKGLLLSLGGLFCVLRPTWFVAVFPLFTVFYGVRILILGIRKIQWAVDMLRTKQKYWFVALIGAILSLVIEAVADILTFIFKRK